MLLAGDIGGTGTRLVLTEDGASFDRPVDLASYRSSDHPGLVPLIRQFLARSGTQPRVAAFGVAGPVLDGRARATNLPWLVDAEEIRVALGCERVTLRNDLETTGIGVLRLPDASFRVLNEGREDPDGNAALIAAGTGLGEAILVRQGRSLRPIPSEGGHSDFAPRTKLQDEVVAWLRERYGRVSNERFVAGPGIKNLYDFCAHRGDPEDPALTAKIAGAAPREAPALVSIAAIDRQSVRCENALALFVAAYGQATQALALTALATGGVFVGGGIAPKVLPALVAGGFMAAFRDHPILGELLSHVPVKVVLDDRASLLGAVALAEESRF